MQYLHEIVICYATTTCRGKLIPVFGFFQVFLDTVSIQRYICEINHGRGISLEYRTNKERQSFFSIILNPESLDIANTKRLEGITVGIDGNRHFKCPNSF